MIASEIEHFFYFTAWLVDPLSEFLAFLENEIFGYEQSDEVYERPKHQSDEVKISYLMFPVKMAVDGNQDGR